MDWSVLKDDERVAGFRDVSDLEVEEHQPLQLGFELLLKWVRPPVLLRSSLGQLSHRADELHGYIRLLCQLQTGLEVAIGVTVGFRDSPFVLKDLDLCAADVHVLACQLRSALRVLVVASDDRWILPLVS